MPITTPTPPSRDDLGGDERIRPISEHPFWVRGWGWVAARELRVGDSLRSHDGSWQVVEGVRNTGREEVVYNCRVAEYLRPTKPGWG